jgi:hypothetical protein
MRITRLSISGSTLLRWIPTFVVVVAFVPDNRRILLRTCSCSRSCGSTSTSQLFLADEIKEYRKGLSQIHKYPQDVNNINPNNKKEYPPRSNQSSGGGVGVLDCVFKFGGSSLANAERIDHVAHLIKDQIELGYRPRAVVCSAMGKTTNNLLSAGEFALGEYCFWGTMPNLHLVIILLSQYMYKLQRAVYVSMQSGHSMSLLWTNFN